MSEPSERGPGRERKGRVISQKRKAELESDEVVVKVEPEDQSDVCPEKPKSVVKSEVEMRWEWQEHGDVWMVYAPQLNTQINQAFGSGKQSVTVHPAVGISLQVDIGKMIQKNTQSGFQRLVRLAVKDEEQFFVWQWQTDENSWIAYDAQTCVTLETSLQSDVKLVSVLLRGQPYTMDLGGMIQKNNQTQFERPIQRCLSAADAAIEPQSKNVRNGPSVKKSRRSTGSLDNEEEESKEEVRTLVLKGKAPVDTECSSKLGKAHVYSEGEDVYDVMLNQGSPETTTVEARNPRFTKSENEALARKVSENYSKLFGHLSAKTSKHEKKEIWKKIARYVSARGTNRRAPDKCKKRFSDLKLKVKNKMAKEKQRRWPTGCRRRVKVTYNASENIIRQLIDASALHGVTNAAESISQGSEDQERPNTEKRTLEMPNILLETTNAEQNHASLALVHTDVSSIEREAENTNNVTAERRSETTQAQPIHDEYISGVHSLPGQHQQCNVGVLDNVGVCTQLGSLSQVVNELKDQIQTTNQILSQLSQNLAKINDTLLARNTQSQQFHSTNAYPNAPHPQTLAYPHPSYSQHGLQRVYNEFTDIQSHAQPTNPTGKDFLNQPQVAFSSSNNLDLNTNKPTGQTQPSTKVLPSVLPPLEQSSLHDRVSQSLTTPKLDSAESQFSSSDKDEG